MLNTISPYYHRHLKVIQGKGALSTLKDVLIDFSSTNPLFIFSETPRLREKIRSIHSSISSSPFIQYRENEKIDLSSIDAIIVYGGTAEIKKCDQLHATHIPTIHIPFTNLVGDEYTHFRGSSDVIIYDWDLCTHLKMPQIGNMMSVMLFYLFASSLEYPSLFTKANISFVLTEAQAIMQEEREKASFITTSLIHVVGGIASNAEHSSLQALMEHLEIDALSTLSQSAATLLLPLVKYIKQTDPSLYTLIEANLEEISVEKFCSYWINLSPLEDIELILRQVISNMYHLLEDKEVSTTLHTFLTSLKEGRR